MRCLFALAFPLLLAGELEDDFRPVGSGTPAMREYVRASILEGQGRCEESLIVLDRVIRKEPRFFRAYELAAECWARLGRTKEGEVYFQRLSQSDPDNGFPHLGLGRLYGAGNSFPGSSALMLSEVRKCLDRDPNAWPCLHWFTDVFRLANQRAVVEVDLRASRLWRPRNPRFYLLWVQALATSDPVKVPAALAHGIELAAAASDLELLAKLRFASGQLRSIESSRSIDDLRLVLGFYRDIGDLESWLEILGEIAGFKDVTGDYPAAENYHQHRLDCARAFNHGHALVRALQDFATFKFNRGDSGLAVELLSEASELPARMEVHRSVMLKRASLLRRLGRLDEARQVYHRLNRSCEGKDLVGSAFAKRGLSLVFADQGDSFRALREGRESVAIFDRLGMKWQANAGRGNLGGIFAEMGNLEVAETYHWISHRSALRLKDRTEEARTLANLGEVALARNELHSAVASLSRAIRMKTNVLHLEVGFRTALSVALERLGRKADAGVAIREARQLALASADLTLQAETQLAAAEFLLRRGDLDQANTGFRSALDFAERIGFTTVNRNARAGLGEIAKRQGKLPEAAGHLRAAVALLESERTLAPTSELGSSFQRKNAKIYENLIETLTSQQRNREAFVVSEQMRARGFLDTLAEGRGRVTRGLTLFQLRRQQELESALISSRDEGARKSAELAMAEFVTSVRASNPRYAAVRYPQPLAAEEATALARTAGVTFLVYRLGDIKSFVWTVRASGIQLGLLPGRRVLEQLVTALRREVSHPPRPMHEHDWSAIAQKLWSLLVDSADLSVESSNLIIVPDGMLNYLPFEILKNRNGRLLVEDHVIGYAPSVSGFAALAQRVQSAPSYDLLAWGDPDYGGGSEQGVVRSALRSTGFGLPRLPNSRLELSKISAMFPQSRRLTFVGSQATEVSVKQANLHASILHFATHAVVDEAVPARSGIVLSLSDPGGEDGVLRIGEIVNLDIDANLVVLSACNTGLGQLQRGEGLVGLTRAFHYSGASRVVVTMWEVADSAAPALMEWFYHGLTRQLPVTAALREAKLRRLTSGGPQSHPYYWASFVVVGAK